jgi:hypothetical protein
MLTQQDAIYIIEKVLPNSGGTIKKDKLEELIKFSNALTGQNLGLPGCSCEYQAFWYRCYSVLNQHIDVINALAYPPQPKSRKTKNNA